MTNPCKPGKEKNANGRCVKIRECEDPNKEKNANGRCVKKCQSFQHRSLKPKNVQNAFRPPNCL